MKFLLACLSVALVSSSRIFNVGSPSHQYGGHFEEEEAHQYGGHAHQYGGHLEEQTAHECRGCSGRGHFEGDLSHKVR